MPEHPKLGMHFETSREKLLKFKTVKTNPWMQDSLINQVRLAEGEGAAKELTKEVNAKRHSKDGDFSRSFSGAGARSCGVDVCPKCKFFMKYCECKKEEGNGKNT